MPLLSVVVPNYNHARFLAQRLDSIFNQTFKDFEVIILDDASTDDSRAVVARYLDYPRVRFVPNSDNSGSPFAQWNRGVSLASGELVWIAESDDFSDLNFLATLVPQIVARSTVGVIYCQSWRVDDDGCVHGSIRDLSTDLNAPRWHTGFTRPGRYECAEHLIRGNTIPNASAVLFRRQLYLATGGAPTDMRLSGDWLAWVRLLLRCEVTFEPRELNYFRFHSQSARSQTTYLQSFRERCRIQRTIIASSAVNRLDLRRLVHLLAHEIIGAIRLAPMVQRPRLVATLSFAAAPLLARAPLVATRAIASRLLGTILFRTRSQRARST
jgi:glycosyltransferase involved in cell wall biosynthesis